MSWYCEWWQFWWVCCFKVLKEGFSTEIGFWYWEEWLEVITGDFDATGSLGGVTIAATATGAHPVSELCWRSKNLDGLMMTDRFYVSKYTCHLGDPLLNALNSDGDVATWVEPDTDGSVVVDDQSTRAYPSPRSCVRRHAEFSRKFLRKIYGPQKIE